MAKPTKPVPAFREISDAKLIEYRDNFEAYARECLRVRAKGGGLVSFGLNRAQRHLNRMLDERLGSHGMVRALCLKGRQQGVSTFTQARFWHKISMAGIIGRGGRQRKGLRAAILTHQQAATDNLFEITQRYYDNLEPALKPMLGASNSKEMALSLLDNSYLVATAGSRGAGRSSTAQLFHGCLSPETQVIDGFGGVRRMGDFSVGDTVRTHTGKVASISHISSKQASLMSVRFRGVSFPLEATGEHRFWTREGWAEMRSLRLGDEVGFPVREIVYQRGIRFDFRQPAIPRPQGGGSVEHVPEFVYPTYELGRILGLYLAEGSIIFQHKTGTPSAVTFTVHEREAERTERWLNALGGLVVSIRTAPRKPSRAVAVTAYGKSFAAFVLGVCGRVDSKRMPERWDLCGEPFVRGLAHGYLAGDGHSSKRSGDRRISAPSIRSAITFGMREALASLGYGWACISTREAGFRNGRNEQKQWTLRLCGSGVDRLCGELGWAMPPRMRTGSYGETEIKNGYAWLKIVDISEPYPGRVMDFEVEHEDHSYCVAHGATHNSEMAFWPDAEDHMSGIGQAVPSEPGTEIILESTANGVGNLFHKMWLKAEAGEGDYVAIFLPWFWQEEYARPAGRDFKATEEEEGLKKLYGLTDEQLAWRRVKIVDDFSGDALRFQQEYPNCPAEAFVVVDHESLIDPVWCLRAVKEKQDRRGPLVIGVDPARFGEDATAVVRRQGRVAFGLERWRGLDTMQVAGRVAHMIRKENPVKVFIDEGGLGAGVLDRLRELGFRQVQGVQFGGKAFLDERFVNRRSEMWGGGLREWLRDGGVQLPDDGSLVSDLIGPGYTYDSNGRLKLESKDDMRKRGVKSPDAADALALTFALPVAAVASSANLLDGGDEEEGGDDGGGLVRSHGWWTG